MNSATATHSASTSSDEVRHVDMPIAGRLVEIRGFSPACAGAEQGSAARAATNSGAPGSANATAEIVFTTGAGVKRYDYFRERWYIEELVVDASAVRLGRLERGAPLLNSHAAWSLEDQLGVVESPRIEGGTGTCRAMFSRRESVSGYVQDVADGVVRNVSVGYVRHRVGMVAPEQEGDLWRYLVLDWEPHEISLVPIPADMDSQVLGMRAGVAPATQEPQLDAVVRSLAERMYPCEFFVLPAAGSAEPTTRSINMTQQTADVRAGAAAPAAASVETPPAIAATETRAAPAVAAPAATPAINVPAEIAALCERHGVSNLTSGLIARGASMEEANRSVLEALALRSAASGGHHNTRVQTVRDEGDVRMAGMLQAIEHRVMPGAKLDDNGRQFRSLTLLEMGREFLESRGIDTRNMDKLTLSQTMLHYRAPGYGTVSDIPSLMANVANKRLRSAYEENPGTYKIWARRAPNAPDFKSINVAVLSSAPDLLPVNEHGEFKVGYFKDGAETYSVATSGRIVALTRQAIINDDLRGFDRMTTMFGNAAWRLENRLVYAQLTSNPTMADTLNLFEASTHANLGTGGASALQESSLVTGRLAMRKQKGMQSEELNIAPVYLIVPAALEMAAYKLTSNAYVPNAQSAVSEFRQGGRASLTVVVDSLLDASSATAWYLAADNSQIDTVEYCYLDGAEGPYIESEPGFEVDGVSYKCRLDFAAKVIDYRGLYKSAGA